MEAIFEVATSVILLKLTFRHVDWNSMRSLLLGAVLGSLLGTFIFVQFSSDMLLKSLGIVILIFALNLLSKTTILFPHKLALPAGVMGGIFGGMFGTSGPPLAVYLSHHLRDKNILRATLTFLFLIDYSFRLIVYGMNGSISIKMLELALYLTPAFLIGIVLGSKVHLKISHDQYKRLVAIILIVSGVALLLR